jgi:hypothetical protein
MPPRHAYWTIILEGKPTAFRAHTRDELMPTFRQLLGKHPETVMVWFARGRIWQSPEHEREAAAAQRRAAIERRAANWRPGGVHRDPRDRFKVPRDEKRRRFAAKLRRDRDERPRDASEPDTPSRPERPGGPQGRPARPRARTFRQPGSDSKPSNASRPSGAGAKQRPRGPGARRNDRNRRGGNRGGGSSR